MYNCNIKYLLNSKRLVFKFYVQLFCVIIIFLKYFFKCPANGLKGWYPYLLFPFYYIVNEIIKNQNW